MQYAAKSVRIRGGRDASSHRVAIFHGLMRYSSARLNCNKLEDEFDIRIDKDLRAEVEEMCNLGQGILERGEARGKCEGRREAKEEMIIEMYKEGMSTAIIAKIAKASKHDIEQILLYSQAIRFSFPDSTCCPIMQYGLFRNWKILALVSINNGVK